MSKEVPNYSYQTHCQMILDGIPVPAYGGPAQTTVAAPSVVVPTVTVSASASAPSVTVAATAPTPSICNHGGVQYWSPPSIW